MLKHYLDNEDPLQWRCLSPIKHPFVRLTRCSYTRTFLNILTLSQLVLNTFSLHYNTFDFHRSIFGFAE